MRFEKVTLEGKFVKLEPLSASHRDGLCQAIYDGELWNLYVTLVPHPKDIDSFLDQANAHYERGCFLHLFAYLTLFVHLDGL